MCTYLDRVGIPHTVVGRRVWVRYHTARLGHPGTPLDLVNKSETTGNLKIAVADISNLRGNSATSSVGSVTVTV